MTARPADRKSVLLELLATEKQYVHYLRCLDDVWYSPLLELASSSKNNVRVADVETIFINLAEILAVNQNFLHSLASGIGVLESSTSGGGGANNTQTPEQLESSLWKMGESCHAVWLTDGAVYPAVILEPPHGGTVLVEYIGFGETAMLPLDHVLDQDTGVERWLEDGGDDDDGGVGEYKDCFVGAVFTSFIPLFHVYQNFTAGSRASSTMITKLLRDTKKSSAFRTFYNSAEQHPSAHGLDLHSLLIMPVQRVPRYRLLIMELLKHTPAEHPDRAELDAALTSIMAMADSINEAVRQAEALQALNHVEWQLKFALPIVQERRTQLKTGMMSKICRGGVKKYCFFLFNDLLLYAEPTSSSSRGGGVGRKQRYNLHRSFPISASVFFTVAVVPPFPLLEHMDKHNPKHSLRISNPQKTFVVFCDTEAETQEWFDAIQGAVDVAEQESAAQRQEMNAESAAILQQLNVGVAAVGATDAEGFSSIAAPAPPMAPSFGTAPSFANVPQAPVAETTTSVGDDASASAGDGGTTDILFKSAAACAVCAKKYSWTLKKLRCRRCARAICESCGKQGVPGHGERLKTMDRRAKHEYTCTTCVIEMEMATMARRANGDVSGGEDENDDDDDDDDRASITSTSSTKKKRSWKKSAFKRKKKRDDDDDDDVSGSGERQEKTMPPPNSKKGSDKGIGKLKRRFGKHRSDKSVDVDSGDGARAQTLKPSGKWKKWGKKKNAAADAADAANNAAAGANRGRANSLSVSLAESPLGQYYSAAGGDGGVGGFIPPAPAFGGGDASNDGGFGVIPAAPSFANMAGGDAPSFTPLDVRRIGAAGGNTIPIAPSFGNNGGSIPPAPSFGSIPPAPSFGSIPPAPSFGDIPSAPVVANDLTMSTATRMSGAVDKWVQPHFDGSSDSDDGDDDEQDVAVGPSLGGAVPAPVLGGGGGGGGGSGGSGSVRSARSNVSRADIDDGLFAESEDTEGWYHRAALVESAEQRNDGARASIVGRAAYHDMDDDDGFDAHLTEREQQQVAAFYALPKDDCARAGCLEKAVSVSSFCDAHKPEGCARAGCATSSPVPRGSAHCSRHEGDVLAFIRDQHSRQQQRDRELGDDGDKSGGGRLAATASVARADTVIVEEMQRVVPSVHRQYLLSELSRRVLLRGNIKVVHEKNSILSSCDDQRGRTARGHRVLFCNDAVVFMVALMAEDTGKPMLAVRRVVHCRDIDAFHLPNTDDMQNQIQIRWRIGGHRTRDPDYAPGRTVATLSFATHSTKIEWLKLIKSRLRRNMLL